MVACKETPSPLPLQLYFYNQIRQEQSKPAHDGAEFSEEDRDHLELQKTFVAMTHLDMGDFFGVPRNFMPAYSRFCFAWRLYSYFNTPVIQVVKDAKFKPTFILTPRYNGLFICF